ncbi:MAG: ArsR family transcriptional regulator [Candidatus Nitrosocosmicus sp.]|nr:ArsR family transcriptional regulator [Candidatus Nitrosocosmicus sp.]
MNSPDSDSNNKKDADNNEDRIGGSEFKNDNNKNNKPNINGEKPVDPRFKRLLWSMIVSTRGGINRAKVINFLIKSPSNANQVSVQLKLDYKTVIHHLNVLNKNSLIVTDNEDAYGATYFISPLMEKNYSAFKEIMDKIGKK